MADLTEENIIQELKDKISVQDYSAKEMIDGVRIKNLNLFVEEDGDFMEVLRLSEDGEVEDFPGFKIAQINKTKVNPGSVKAWHLHFKQDELWYLVPDGQIIAGLWDVRKDSKTSGKTQKVILGGGIPKLLYIPKGVAHGYMNLTPKTNHLIYFLTSKFDKTNPDERRLPWNAAGEEFWTPTIG